MARTMFERAPESLINDRIGGYPFTHPWYYVRGGSLLPMKQLITLADHHETFGYAQDEIEAAGKRKGGARIDALAELHGQFKAKLLGLSNRYLQAAHDLETWRASGGALSADTMDEVHSNAGYVATQTFIALHHLALIERERAGQGDLFAV